MRAILKITFTELQTLFCSPVAWILLILFSFTTGMEILHHLEPLAASGEYGNGGITSQTFWIFQDLNDGFFINMQKGLFFYIPLLTMGLFSREKSSGSIRLLLSSPLSLTEIVLGKFLSMMVFGLLLIATLAAAVLAAGVAVVGMDYSSILLAMAGAYLLFCTYAAVGLFMSSLTGHQVVAAISTLALLAVLNYLREIGQDNEVFRNISYILSLSGRTFAFISGLFNTKDLCYFILVMVLFLGLTVIRMKNERDSSTRVTRLTRFALLIIFVLAGGSISSRPGWIAYKDVTASKGNSLNPANVELLRRIRRPVVVRAYTNLLDAHCYLGLPYSRNQDLDFWERYRRYLPGMKLEYTTYYDTSGDAGLFKANAGRTAAQVARRSAIGMDLDPDELLSPAQVRGIIDLRGEEHRFVRQISVGDRSVFLRVYDEPNPAPGESEVVAAFKQFSVPAPAVAFVSGQNERRIDSRWDDGYNNLSISRGMRKSLINQGFRVFNISLADSLPRDLACLVIADPKVAFSDEEIVKIRNYIASGGNLCLAAEPGRQALLNPLLSGMGAGFLEGELVQESKDNAPDHLETGVIALDGAVGIYYTQGAGVRAEPMAVIDTLHSWNRMGPIDMKRGSVRFEAGDQRGAIPVCLKITRMVGGREQRIFLSGDADLMSNVAFKQPANVQLCLNLFSWFSKGEYPVTANVPLDEVDQCKIRMKDLGPVKALFLMVIPGVLLLWGGGLIFVRMRR